MYVVVLALYVLVAGQQMSVSHSVMSGFLQVRHQKEYLLKESSVWWYHSSILTEIYPISLDILLSCQHKAVAILHHDAE